MMKHEQKLLLTLFAKLWLNCLLGVLGMLDKSSGQFILSQEERIF